jgi:predicted nuclease of restriction endonuclease-like RecB superfamily
VKGYMESLEEIQYRMDTGRPMSRKRTYHGVEFRSKLEARFAQHLDALGETWVYEPRIYGPSGRGYLPDFQIVSASRPTFIEVKPTLEEVADAKAKMSVIWETHPDALLMVAVEEARAFFVSLAGSPWRTWQERWAA